MPWSFLSTGNPGGLALTSSGNLGGGMSFLGPSVSAEIVTNGLLMNLDAGNASSYPGSGTTWTDLSGNGVNGTLTNGPTFNSANGGSIFLDNVDDYVIFNTTTFPAGNSPFTMEIMFNSVSNNSRPMFSYGRDQGGGNACPILAVLTSNKSILTFGSNTGDVLSNTTIITGTWYHMCGVYTTTQTQMYINGVLENTTNYSSANVILNNNVNGNFGALGALFSGFGNLGNPLRYGPGNVSIAKAAVYNRALTAPEVLQNFNAIRGRFGI